MNRIEKFNISARISEQTVEKKDMEFVKDKISRGIPKSEIVRNAINIYRKYEEGTLIMQALENYGLLNVDDREVFKEVAKAASDKDLSLAEKNEIMQDLKNVFNL